MLLTPSTIGAIQQDPLRRTFKQASLDLRFAENKSLVDATTGQNLVTFTRASSGTYVDSQGVIQRATTNLITTSEALVNITGASITNNTTTAPGGLTTADTLTEDTSTGAHSVNTASITWVGNTVYTFTIFLKANTRNQVNLAFGTSSNWVNGQRSAVFNLSTGTVASSASSPVVASIEAYPNGWYRCRLTATTVASPVPSTTQIQMYVSGSSSYTGDGTSGLFFWGAQLEQSSTVGEYIPTTGTINSAPRFDHNPTTGESLGLLVEESRTNLSQQSDNFSDAYWTKTDCTITANESTAPDGTLTADLWTNTASPGIVASSTITKDATARTYTGSLWVKGGGTAFTLSIDSTTSANRGRAVFNMSSGTLTNVFNDGNFTNTSGTITAFANGWYRLTVTTTTSTFTGIRLRPFFSGAGSSARIWGAQIEEGAFPTSYIPTTTATVTRSADVTSITGSNFSSWYRQDEGTVFVNASAAVAASIFPCYVSFDNGTTSERLQLRRVVSGTSPSYRVVASGQSIDSATKSIGSPAGFNSQILAYASNNYEGACNGVLEGLSSIANRPAATQAQIGTGAGSAILNGTIRRLTYFPIRLANEVLQRITQ